MFKCSLYNRMEENNKKPIDNKRLERYIEKLEHFNKLAERLDNWTEEVGEKGFLALDLKDQFAIYHAFQIIIEIITDLIAMTVKDLKIKPTDDYTNIIHLKEQNFLTEELTESLRKLNGLRNVIVHDYNGIDELLVYRGIKENFHFIKQFYKVMREWLQNKY